MASITLSAKPTVTHGMINLSLLAPPTPSYSIHCTHISSRSHGSPFQRRLDQLRDMMKQMVPNAGHHTTPSMKDVSRNLIKVRRKPISLRVFSKITCGSWLSHRKQFGAITIARLFTSILVTAAFSGAPKT